MISSRIIEIATNLPNEQLDRLAKFLDSPYHNTGYNSQRIIALFQIVRTSLAKGEPSGLAKQVLNQHFYPDHPFVAKKKNPIDALASDLFAKMKQFLFFEYVQEPTFAAHQPISLARFYRLHNFEERFWQLVKHFRKTRPKQGHRDANFYLDAFLLEAEVAAFRSTYNTYTDDANITETHRFLDQFYATQKLENAAILAFQRKLSAGATSEEKQTEVLVAQNYNDYPSFHTPLADHYKTILTWLQTPPDPLALDEFVVLVKSQKDKIESSKFRNLMAFYRYFLSLQYQAETSGGDVLQKLLITFKEHLDAGFLQLDSKLMPATLKSLVNLATKAGEIEWAKSVLHDYPPKRITGTRFPEEAHSLCEAEVLFANQEHAAAEQKLKYCNFENINYSIVADVLLIKIYYSLEDELIHNRIQALEKKVRRSKLSTHNKSAYLNFLRFLLRALKYKHDRHSTKWQKLCVSLKEISPILEREWLQSIVGE